MNNGACTSASLSKVSVLNAKQDYRPNHAIFPQALIFLSSWALIFKARFWLCHKPCGWGSEQQHQPGEEQVRDSGSVAQIPHYFFLIQGAEVSCWSVPEANYSQLSSSGQ